MLHAKDGTCVPFTQHGATVAADYNRSSSGPQLLTKTYGRLCGLAAQVNLIGENDAVPLCQRDPCQYRSQPS